MGRNKTVLASFSISHFQMSKEHQNLKNDFLISPIKVVVSLLLIILCCYFYFLIFFRFVFIYF